ncbi:hypothetical protein V1282_005127 [Nitrobacteraceae bacterium AZCC 2146]
MTGRSGSRTFASANGKFGALDPFLDLRARFVIRWIAPDSRKIELGALQTAIKKWPRGWLHAAAKTVEQAVQRDFTSWQK